MTQTNGGVARFTNGFNELIALTIQRGVGDKASRQEVTLAPGQSFDLQRAEAIEIGGTTFVVMSQQGKLVFVPPIRGGNVTSQSEEAAKKFNEPIEFIFRRMML